MMALKGQNYLSSSVRGHSNFHMRYIMFQVRLFVQLPQNFCINLETTDDEVNILHSQLV